MLGSATNSCTLIYLAKGTGNREQETGSRIWHQKLSQYSTVFWYYKPWREKGVIENLRYILHPRVREQVKKKGNGQPS